MSWLLRRVRSFLADRQSDYNDPRTECGCWESRYGHCEGYRCYWDDEEGE